MSVFPILVGAALICLVVFGSIASIFVAPGYFRSKEREKLQDNIRAAIDKGQPLPPEVLETLTRDIRRVPSRTRDIRRGIVWLAIAAGIAAMGALALVNDEWDGGYGAFGLAAIPGCVGLAFLMLGLTNKDKS